jgi:hydroxyacyl-ACP dehydratase HTD2-like protein with hotdog domain
VPGRPGLADYVERWAPKTVTDSDPLAAGPIAALAAALDIDDVATSPGERVLPFWHWLHFLDWPRRSELGADGHPSEGHFHPPIPDRRRMVAGGRLEVAEPLEIGVDAQRTRSLAGVQVKEGRTGEMVFVTVRSEISQGGRVRVVEEHDVVYRSGEDPGRASLTSIDLTGEPASDAAWQRPFDTDSRLLFRFSALTANAHRIHYDEPYVTGVEGYPGLVVHGPLLVLLMGELARGSAKRVVASFGYRLRRPVFVGESILVTGDGAEFAIATARESAHATAKVSFR